MILSILVLLLVTFAAGQAVAQTATFSAVSGKVEVREPGGSWQAASVDQTVPIGATISTGFGARAEIEAGEATLTVSPLTRLTIEELAREADTQQTDLFLGVGRVRANVRTGEDTTHDFQLRSSVSTAAVRGTEFVYDGYEVRGFEGTVVFSSPAGIEQTVSQGDQSSFDGPGAQPSNPRNERRRSSRPQPRPTPQTRETRNQQNEGGPPVGGQGGIAGGGPGGGQDEFEDVDADALITVQIDWPN
jgi:hypothetical protein